MSRAAFNSVTESASMNWIAWYSEIFLPDADRSSAHDRASSMSRSAAPQQRAAIMTRSSENQRLVPSFPPPQRRALSGTRQLVNLSSTCLEAYGSCMNVGVRTISDRKSTRLNSSHANISYAVFCLNKKKSNHKILV